MEKSPSHPLMSKEELHAYFASIAERYDNLSDRVTIVSLDARRLEVQVDLESIQLRPGGSVSGPAQFSLVDSVGWMMTVAHCGVGWDAFTAEVSMQFLRPLLPAKVTVEAEMLRRGRRLVMQMAIDPSPEGPATHAVVSFVARRT